MCRRVRAEVEERRLIENLLLEAAAHGRPEHVMDAIAFETMLRVSSAPGLAGRPGLRDDSVSLALAAACGIERGAGA
jgi:hypothetical protein